MASVESAGEISICDDDGIEARVPGDTGASEKDEVTALEISGGELSSAWSAARLVA